MFTLSHPVNNIQRLVELYDAGAYREVDDLFAPFATLAHTLGYFLLVPVQEDSQTGKPSPATNFNLVRDRAKSDYLDLTLEAIRRGEFRAFFEENGVAPQFDIATMPRGFAEFIERNHVGTYIGP